MTFKEKNHEWISLTLKTTSLILDNLTRDEGMYGSEIIRIVAGSKTPPEDFDA